MPEVTDQELVERFPGVITADSTAFSRGGRDRELVVALGLGVGRRFR